LTPHLQGFFDDSGSHRAEPFYVLAGFISTADKWESFAAQWMAKLNEFPILRYFKMSEANAMAGQFRHGWSPSTRDQRVFELAEIIKAHAMVRVTSRLARSDFNAFVAGTAPGSEINDPYFLCFYQLVFAVHTFQMKNDNAVCDLIFDEQGAIGIQALKWWKGGGNANVDYARLKFFENCKPPVFGNDKTQVQIQAADMLAWVVRECQGVGLKKLNILAQAIIGQLDPLEQIDRAWSRDDLLQIGARSLVERTKELGWLAKPEARWRSPR
jgi:hypothetical protein